jgi:2-isopropylmalate synthase
MQIAFYKVIQEVADKTAKEMTPEDIEQSFRAAYHLGAGYDGRFGLLDYSLESASSAGFSFEQSPSGLSKTNPSNASSNNRAERRFSGKIRDRSIERTVFGIGNGPVSALLDALAKDCNLNLDVREYSEHSIGTSKETKAASYVELSDKSGRVAWGVGIDVDVTAASLRAVLSAASSLSVSEEERAEDVKEAVESGGLPNVKGIAINGN